MRTARQIATSKDSGSSPNDTDYWQANSFPFVFQNVTSFFKLGGNDVNIYGGGTIDGNGQAWYDLYAKDIYTLRPVLFGIDGLKNSILSDLVLRYSPEYYHFVANSSNVIFDNINIEEEVTVQIQRRTRMAGTPTGVQISRFKILTSLIVIIALRLNQNSTNILVQNLVCTGSHGISVGSLGQYVGQFDIVENFHVYNISMTNASDGARIKVWPNTPPALSGDLKGGGGSGRVSNITYDTMYINNVDYAIEYDQCYGQKNLTLCLGYPSPLTITDIVFKNFIGKTSTK
ncbi:hypothetical protein GMDG_02919 [Pseudogymnoascus destructans 20631-21]|uniref:galacturonan 1,4-alpha-galacturonidase n=1 Tax=Pseudogymnoascus destructans (strain ATCC MYA-4855 / 20631-21) TaxID=658429 RepID=L8G4S0_PSED2|nr:hypothetical protein GMDG_02919 [Pseudogymnoascus destructans 20631-21]